MGSFTGPINGRDDLTTVRAYLTVIWILITLLYGAGIAVYLRHRRHALIRARSPGWTCGLLTAVITNVLLTFPVDFWFPTAACHNNGMYLAISWTLVAVFSFAIWR